MPYRISSNIAATTAARHLSQSQLLNEKSLQQLASGTRLVSAGDDAAGFAIAEGLKSQAAGQKSARQNAEMAQAMVQTAEGGLNEQNNILVRLRELAVTAASDTVSDEEREMVNTEFQELTAEFDRIAKSTRFGRKELLTGSGEEFEFQVGPYNGDENVIKMTLASNTTASEAGVDGLSVDDQDAAGDALSDIDSAMLHVANARSSFGALQSRFQHSIDHLMASEEGIRQAHSVISDTDVAEATTNLAKSQLMLEAGSSVLAQANADSMRVLKLIHP